jgi:hypothetical protein
MFDLAESNHVVQGLMPTTGTNASVPCDYINMKNFHTIWSVISYGGGDTAPDITPRVAEDYTGTGASSVGNADFWVCSGTTILDRWTKSTAVRTLDGTTHLLSTTSASVLVRYNPSEAASSKTYFHIHLTKWNGPINVLYIGESRYKGSQQFIATTSST